MIDYRCNGEWCNGCNLFYESVLYVWDQTLSERTSGSSNSSVGANIGLGLGLEARYPLVGHCIRLYCIGITLVFGAYFSSDDI